MMSLADLAVGELLVDTERPWSPVLDTIIVTIVSLCQNFEVILARMHLNVSNFSYFIEGSIIFFSLRECPEHPSVMPSKHCLSKIIRKKYLRQHSSKARH